MDASEDRREVVDESPLFFHGTGETMVVLHGWKRERRRKEEQEKKMKNDRNKKTRQKLVVTIQLVFKVLFIFLIVTS